MLVIAIVAAGLWILVCCSQLLVAGVFWRLIQTQKTTAGSVQDKPEHASILLAVRGCDPFFRQCLQAILEQKYQSFDVHLVIDNENDPAWSIAQEIKQSHPQGEKLFIHQMKSPLPTCGLKCSALIQGVQAINEDSRYLALIDSDVVAHDTWLKELTAPLTDSRIGVVTGNQWFCPESPAMAGSLVRSLWNAGSIVPTTIFANPWAGSLAMRMETIRQVNLVDLWRESIVDDGPIRKAIEPLGLRIQFQPSLITLNREQCSLAFVSNYIARTLTWSRIYESTFVFTFIHALVTTAAFVACLVVAMAAVFFDWNAFAIAAGGLIIGAAILLIAYLLVRQPISEMYKSRAMPLPKLSPGRLMKLLILLPVTQMLYFQGVIRAITAKSICWRNVTYHIKGKNRFEILNHRPLVQQSDSDLSI